MVGHCVSRSCDGASCLLAEWLGLYLPCLLLPLRPPRLLGDLWVGGWDFAGLFGLSWGDLVASYYTLTFNFLVVMAVPGVNVGDDMAVEKIDSPTELAADSDGEEPEPKIEKRKREAARPRRRRSEERGRHDAPVAPSISDDDEDEEQDSPSKRANSRPDDRPLTAGLLRDLLADHRKDMQQAWQVVEDRLGKVENQQLRQTGELASLAGRMKISERDVAAVKKSQTSGEKKIEKLAEDVANLQVQFQDVQAKVTEFQTDKGEIRDDGGGIGHDPWGAYLRKSRRWPPPVGPPGMSTTGMPSTGMPGGLPGAPSNDTGDQLSEEDRRTLIIGGWLQDTRRATIEEESAKLLQHGEIKPLIDSEKLAVYGPRRSVGMLRFVQRPDEHGDDIKSRMWKVVKKVAELKMQVESSKAMGEDRTMWAAFVKTKVARTRSAHISMVRRVVMGLAADAKNEAGGVLNLEHTHVTAYDMDWSAGTIWCGVHKLASSTHRCPRSAETITMTGGWIDLDAVGLVAGCSQEVAKTAFEREI